jgi:GNAT superfamily N-acetyltransferase
MPAGITIRVAKPNERKALEELQWRASLVWPEYREALLAHPEAIELPLEHIETNGTYVAERDGQILGFGVVLMGAGGRADLDGLFVEPAAWKQGIGRCLIGEAERLAASQGAEWLYVVANPKARGFYDACEFESVGAEQTRFGPALLMRKRLAILNKFKT